MKICFKNSDLKKTLDAGGGAKIVLYNSLAKEKEYGELDCARNVYLVNNEGEVGWRVFSSSDAAGDPFVDIYMEEGELYGSRWDSFRYMINIETGKAIRDDFIK